nr:response regulator [Desulfobulbaceae bacterium]
MGDLRILVVDDFNTMQRIIGNILHEIGYTKLVFANDGEKAFKILLKEKIDLVISDWSMPHMTGIELLRKVRVDPGLAHMKFIMVTAEGEKTRIIEAVNGKVDQYIIKPFSADTLKEKINAVFKEGS